MRRIALAAAVTAGLALAAPALAADPPPPAEPAASWAQPQIEQVVAAGFFAPTVEEFRPDEPLARAELAPVLSVLAGREVVLPEPERLVTLQELDRRLVKQLGLMPLARHLRSAAGAAGIKTPGRFGTEVLARLLGLRTNHPEAEDVRELGPTSTVTRAEAAFSLARVLTVTEEDKAWVSELVSGFALPELSDWQRRILERAFRFVGYPYVWGGSSELEQAPFEVTVPGGFDCSGFVWRVYKLEPWEDAPVLAEMLEGRTTYDMSGEVTKAQRIPPDQIQAADLVFFGDKGRKSKPAQIGHMGIALGNGWFVHSSGRGVTVTPLEGWYAERLAWARRPLAEAGLA
jgi:cell wall-associated NlpC family hydrolase